jgi:hypothetical protein
LRECHGCGQGPWSGGASGGWKAAFDSRSERIPRRSLETQLEDKCATFVHVALLTTKVRTAQRSGCVVYTPFQQQRLMGCPWPATTLLRTPRLTASCPRPAQPFERTTHSGTLTHPPPQTESCSLGKTLLLRARQALNTQACVSPSARCLLATGIVAPLR